MGRTLTRATPRARRLAAPAAIGLLTLAPVACGSADQSEPASDGTLITGAGGASTWSGGGSTAHATTAETTSGAGGGSSALGPPYPVVFAHGFFGFDQFAGIDGATYFFGVKDALAKVGETVHTPAVDPFNSSIVRGAELLEKVETIVGQTGRRKVVLVAHSQGGLDARVVAHDRPDLVAAVITIAAPHHGTPVADVALSLLSNPATQEVVDALVKLIGAPLYDAAGNQTSATAALEQISKAGIDAFNAAYPDQPGVFYASLAGRTAYDPGGAVCDADTALPFVQAWGSTVDPVDPLLGPTELVLQGGFGEHFPNDGLVRVDDAKWDAFWGCLPADHLDEIGQLLGDSPGYPNDWNYLDFYVALVQYLRAAGY